MKNQRSCNELGHCQSRKPACQGCNWRTAHQPFAPGTIEGPFSTRRYRAYFSQTARLVSKHMATIAPTLLVVAMFSGVIARKLGWV